MKKMGRPPTAKSTTAGRASKPRKPPKPKDPVALELPTTPDGFEELCLVLLRDRWQLPSLERFGRSGQRQDGLDLLATDDPERRAVQCKLRADGGLTVAEVEREVEAVLGITGVDICDYLIVTSGRRDTEISKAVTAINARHRKLKLFRVRVWFLEDLRRELRASRLALLHLDSLQLSVVEASLKAIVGAPSVDARLTEAEGLVGRGELRNGLYVLDQLRRALWPEHSVAQRSRWFRVSGDAVLRLGRRAEAAEHLLAALDETPNDEGTVANAIQAKGLIDEPDVDNFGAAARGKFPSSAMVWGASITCASTTAVAVSIASAVPRHLRKTPSVRRAIASRRDLRIDFPDEPEIAAKEHPKDLMGWLHWGLELLQVEGEKKNPQRWKDVPLDDSNLARASQALTKAIELAEAGGQPAIQAEALLHRAALRALLRDIAGVEDDVELAGSLGIPSVGLALARAKIPMEHGEWGAAVNALRATIRRTPGEPEVEAMLAETLWRRAGDGDREQAAEIFRDLVARGGPPKDAVECLLSLGRVKEAGEILRQHAPAFERSSLAGLEGLVALVGDDLTVANECASRALVALASEPEAERSSVERVARLLHRLKRYEDALPLLGRLAQRPSDMRSVRLFISAAQRLELHKEVMSACERVRLAGILQDDLLHAELGLLERYNPQKALAVLESLLAADPSQAGVRVPLVGLALRLDRPDIAGREAPLLPSVAEVETAQMGAAVVDAMRLLGDGAAAASYAYDLLRRFERHPAAHMALQIATLYREQDQDGGYLTPDRAAPGVAVRLQEAGDEAARWLVLEDSTVPAPESLREALPGSPPWLGLSGLRVGDVVDISWGLGPPRMAKIAELLPKDVFRFREVADGWQHNFPGQPGTSVISTPTLPDGELDISAILNLIDSRRREVERAEARFREGPMSLGTLGAELGGSAFDGTLHAIGSDTLRVRCCRGRSDDRAEALAGFEAAGTIVLDGTAVATLFALGMLDVLGTVGKRVVMPHSLLTQLRRLRGEGRASRRAEATLAHTEGGAALHPVTEADGAARATAVASLESTLGALTEVVPTAAVAELSPAVRNALSAALDPVSLDSMAIAATSGCVLLTDDWLAWGLAKTELGGKGIWTHLLLEQLLERGKLSEDSFVGATLKLLSWGYVVLNPARSTLPAAAREAGWLVEQAPLKQALAALTAANTSRADVVRAATRTIADATAEPLSDEVLWRLVLEVAGATSRHSGEALTEAELEAALESRADLSADSRQRALGALRLWRLSQAKDAV